MIEIVLAAAERHAARVAIEEADDRRVSYAELLARARAFAKRCRPRQVVELVATRSADFVASCLGAWLAGAAWVPVDPGDPRPRPAIEWQPGLAYAIPTSGTSGTPRAVLVSHRGLAPLVRAQVAAFELGPGDRALWLHAPLFDASISDWGTALAAGATLVVPGTIVATQIAARAITHVDLPPVLLRHLPAQLPPALRVVILGGEACPVATVEALAREVRVVVVYGPTETTVCSSLVEVVPERWTHPLIGDPIEGTRFDIVDGELWIGGAGVALGYAGDPEATARRFVVRDGESWFRTGDRVVHVESGLAFAGRLDRQVKIRGRRVELDEIEAAIRELCGGEVAVELRGGRPVAFVEGDAELVRSLLRSRLPHWMLPARVIELHPLPRTPTGKIDRSALVVPAVDLSDHADPAARELAALWCDAIGCAAVRADDRFDEAGGDSLARLTLEAATGLALDGNPSFGELLARHQPPTLAVAACEARVRAPRERPTLITGATGQLGTALLAAWRGPVIALARRDVPGVETVRCDLAHPWFGLDEEAWCALVDRVGAIVHAGATIQLGGGWDAHAPVNVDGTREVAMLATAAGAALHHVSTLSVFVATDRRAGRHDEHAWPAADAVVHGGYAQTKLAAETIVRGRATIYRLGLLVGTEPRATDQLQMTIRGLHRLGVAPAGARELRFDITPVAYAAQAIAALAARDVVDIHHIAGTCGASFGELVDVMQLPELPAAAWAERARSELADPDIAMAYMAIARRGAFDLFLATGADFATGRTRTLLDELGVPPPQHDLARIVRTALESR